MLRVALTGGIASGKTAVSERLHELGALVIDSDVLAREVVEPGSPGLAAVVDRFGTGVLTRDTGAGPGDGGPAGSVLDRVALGKLVFSDSQARADLEQIIHPAVRSRARQLEAVAPRGAIVVHVVPLLVETGQQDGFDIVVVVDVDRDTQVERLQDRNGLSAVEAEARLAAQASREQRLAVADHVLDNRGSLAALHAQVDQLWASFITQGLTASERGDTTIR